MHNITTVADLKNAIRLLEAEQDVNSQLLKEQFYLTYESLKPVNLLRRTLKDISSEPDILNNLLGSVTGLVSGYLSNKVFVGRSGNLFRKLIGAVLQFGVTTTVFQHPDTIRSLGHLILQYFRRKKKRIQ
jgi:hypothetical protein